MPRLSSAFESPPIPGSLPALLDNLGVESHLAQLAIILGRDGLPSAPEVNRADIEPLPYLDYHLVFILLCIYRSANNKREIKRYDYLIEARKYYYRAHYHVMVAFHRLQDAYSYSQQLEREKMKLKRSGFSKLGDLKTIEATIQRNYIDVAFRLHEVDEHRKRRIEITNSFSTMKHDFLESEMPRLNYIGKQAYHRYLETQGKKYPNIIQRKKNSPSLQNTTNKIPKKKAPAHPHSPPATEPSSESQQPSERLSPDLFFQDRSLSGMLNDEISEEALMREVAHISRPVQPVAGNGEEGEGNELDFLEM